MNRNRKNGLWLLLAFLCLLGLAIVFFGNAPVNPERARSAPGGPAGELTVTCLNVGHGDCTVLQQGGEVGMIDTGPAAAYGTVSSFLESGGVRTITFLMLTHFDADHIGSAVELLETYPVETVLIPDYESRKPGYAPLMEVLAHHADVRAISRNTVYDWGGASLRLYPAAQSEAYRSEDADYDNNMSLVCLLTFGENRLLFTGDAENARLNELIGSGEDWSCDWIKMPHHGDSEKKTGVFLKKASPAYAVISCSAAEGPEEDTAQYLRKKKIEQFLTSWGNVATICTGEELQVRYR